MYILFKNFVYFVIFSEVVLSFLFFFDNDIMPHEYFLHEFFFLMYLNFYLDHEYTLKNRLNMDLIFKFFYLFIKTPSYCLNYILNTFKKIFIFIFFFKYRQLLNTFRILFRKYFYRYFIIWRPLFKKTSYFGYYRSNRSKWIK